MSNQAEKGMQAFELPQSKQKILWKQKIVQRGRVDEAKGNSWPIRSVDSDQD
jgi:hypothetical protein